MNKTFFRLWLILALVSASQPVNAAISADKRPPPVTFFEAIERDAKVHRTTSLSDNAVMFLIFPMSGNHTFQTVINGPLRKPSSYVLFVSYLGQNKKEDFWSFNVEQIVLATFGRPSSGPDAYRVSELRKLLVKDHGSACIRGASGSLLISRLGNSVTFAFGRNPKTFSTGDRLEGCLSEDEIFMRIE